MAVKIFNALEENQALGLTLAALITSKNATRNKGNYFTSVLRNFNTKAVPDLEYVRAEEMLDDTEYLFKNQFVNDDSKILKGRANSLGRIFGEKNRFEYWNQAEIIEDLQKLRESMEKKVNRVINKLALYAQAPDH